MQVLETDLPGVLLIEPRVFGDARGYFKEVHEQRRYADANAGERFVQDNVSLSCHGTLRGLHYQLEQPQGKLVQVLDGEIFDVAVDLRRDSDFFGKWTGATLSGENHRQLYVPPGFGHGFCVTGESALVLYKCTDFYHPQSERTVLWNDPAIGIEWPLDGEPIISDKDAQGVPLADADVFEVTP